MQQAIRPTEVAKQKQAQAQTSTVRLFDSASKNQGFKSVQDSKQFLKRVTAVTISSIAYLRGMFPEESFGVKTLEGLNLKVLKSGDDQHPNAKCIIVRARPVLVTSVNTPKAVLPHNAPITDIAFAQEQLVSVFHVIDVAELRKVELAVYSAAACEQEDLLEVWSFRCGSRTPSVEREDGDVPRWMIDLPDDDSLEATRSATLSMLRTLLFTGQTMLPLDRAVRAGDDPCCYLVMKISHEGGEPLELKGFQLSEEDSALFADETVKVAIGAIPTKHLGVKVAVKARPFMFGIEGAEEAAGIGLGLEDDSQQDPPLSFETPQSSGPGKRKRDRPSAPLSLKTDRAAGKSKKGSVAMGKDNGVRTALKAVAEEGGMASPRVKKSYSRVRSHVVHQQSSRIAIAQTRSNFS